MAEVSLKNPDCRDGLLTLGSLKLFRSTPGVGGGLFPDATHVLFVDLLPRTPGGTTTFINPVVVAEILEGQNEGVYRRTFVPWKTNTRGTDPDVNEHWPEVHDGREWQPHLATPGAIYPDPTTRVRLRRADGSLEWRGSKDAPNGVTYRFGLSLTDAVDPSAEVDDVALCLRATAAQVETTSATCDWLVSLSGHGDSEGGFFAAE